MVKATRDDDELGFRGRQSLGHDDEATVVAKAPDFLDDEEATVIAKAPELGDDDEATVIARAPVGDHARGVTVTDGVASPDDVDITLADRKLAAPGFLPRGEATAVGHRPSPDDDEDDEAKTLKPFRPQLGDDDDDLSIKTIKRRPVVIDDEDDLSVKTIKRRPITEDDPRTGNTVRGMPASASARALKAESTAKPPGKPLVFWVLLLAIPAAIAAALLMN